MKNKFKCSLSIWRKLSKEKKMIYNSFMEITKIKNTAKFILPKYSGKITDSDFEVIRHNLIIIFLLSDQ